MRRQGGRVNDASQRPVANRFALLTADTDESSSSSSGDEQPPPAEQAPRRSPFADYNYNPSNGKYTFSDDEDDDDEEEEEDEPTTTDVPVRVVKMRGVTAMSMSDLRFASEHPDLAHCEAEEFRVEIKFHLNQRMLNEFASSTLGQLVNDLEVSPVCYSIGDDDSDSDDSDDSDDSELKEPPAKRVTRHSQGIANTPDARSSRRLTRSRK